MASAPAAPPPSISILPTDRAACIPCIPQGTTSATRPATLTEINKQAVSLARIGDHAGAVSALTQLLESSRQRNVTHPELYIVHCNRAGR